MLLVVSCQKETFLIVLQEFCYQYKTTQGNAAIYILRSAFGVNWSDRLRIIYAGDDLTDEDAMQALKVYTT